MPLKPKKKRLKVTVKNRKTGKVDKHKTRTLRGRNKLSSKIEKIFEDADDESLERNIANESPRTRGRGPILPLDASDHTKDVVGEIISGTNSAARGTKRAMMIKRKRKKKKKMKKPSRSKAFRVFGRGDRPDLD